MLRGLVLLAIATVLSACGGGGDSGGGGGAPGAAGATGQTSFQAFVTAHGAGPAAALPTVLTDTQSSEVASRSRTWAAETVAIAAGSSAGNGVAIPPLYFARVQAVAAAASGTTLSKLRLAVPAPSSASVEGALMRGISRAVSAGSATTVSTGFMNAVTFQTEPGIWRSLLLTLLSAGELASEANLRLRVQDAYRVEVPWPQATAFDGVFEDQAGGRTSGPMIRVVGPLRTLDEAAMAVSALALADGRWIVRITPTVPLANWSATDLDQALGRVTAQLLAPAIAPPTGELILPGTAFAALGLSDLRGMDEARDRVNADMRGLDGHGGTYVEVSSGTASLALSQSGLRLEGEQGVSFIFSPDNRFSAGAGSTQLQPGVAVPCGATDLRPGFLALLDATGRVELLARFVGNGGTTCATGGTSIGSPNFSGVVVN